MATSTHTPKNSYPEFFIFNCLGEKVKVRFSPLFLPRAKGTCFELCKYGKNNKMFVPLEAKAFRRHLAPIFDLGYVQFSEYIKLNANLRRIIRGWVTKSVVWEQLLEDGTFLGNLFYDENFHSMWNNSERPSFGDFLTRERLMCCSMVEIVYDHGLHDFVAKNYKREDGVSCYHCRKKCTFEDGLWGGDGDDFDNRRALINKFKRERCPNSDKYSYTRCHGTSTVETTIVTGWECWRCHKKIDGKVLKDFVKKEKCQGNAYKMKVYLSHDDTRNIAFHLEEKLTDELKDKALEAFFKKNPDRKKVYDAVFGDID